MELLQVIEAKTNLLYLKAKEMGEKAYQLAKTKYNDELFADNILNQMKMMFNYES